MTSRRFRADLIAWRVRTTAAARCMLFNAPPSGSRRNAAQIRTQRTLRRTLQTVLWKTAAPRKSGSGTSEMHVRPAQFRRRYTAERRDWSPRA